MNQSFDKWNCHHANSNPDRAPIYWMHEAVAYLGLDRLGLVKPEQAIYRMVRKGILKPRKIGRFLAFSRAELDHVVTNGERKRTPGRPRKIPEQK
jgi:predicted DNA-binding transcriptional regulator AlpA